MPGGARYALALPAAALSRPPCPQEQRSSDPCGLPRFARALGGIGVGHLEARLGSLLVVCGGRIKHLGHLWKRGQALHDPLDILVILHGIVLSLRLE